MTALLKRAHRVLLITVAAVFGLTLLAPMATLAATDLSVGQQATISNPNGTGANLRSDFSVLDDSTVIGEIPDGTVVTVTDGPYVTDSGVWVWVSSASGEGFVSSDLLAPVSSAPAEEPAAEESVAEEPVAEEEPVSPDLLWQEPIDSGFIVDDNNTIPADGLACRTTPSVDGEVITRLPVNSTLQVVSERIWQGDQSFVHVNCADGAGYVNGAYVVLQSEQAEAPVPEETAAPEEPVDEEAPVPTEAVEDPVEEEPVETEVAEEPVAEGETGPRFVLDNVNLRDAAGSDSNVIDVLPVGEEVNLTGMVDDGYVEASGDFGTGWVAPEFLGTESPVVEEPTEEAGEPTEVPTEDAEEPTEAPTEEVEEPTEPADEPTEVPTEDVEEPTEVPSEDDADEPTEAPATPEATDEADETEAPTEEVIEEPTEEAPVETEVATEDVDETEAAADEGLEAVTPIATDEVTPTEDVTDEPTEAPAEEIVDEPTEDAVDEDPASEPTDGATEEADEVEAPGVAAFDASAMIGSATVTGTNGDGLICRVSPDDGAATLMVLTEGTKVLVSDEAVNGYLGIDCGGFQGFADVNFLWSGGAGDEEIQQANMSLSVSGTGNGLNCRTGPGTNHPVITVLRDGNQLSTRAAASNGWVAVACGGQNGFVATEWVAVGSGNDSGSGSASTGATSGNATVSNTNGDGLYCRSGAGTSYSAITVLSPGQSVSVRGANQGSWTPIVCGGVNGFAHSSYLSASAGSGNGSDDGSTSPGASTGTVTVANTGGSGLNCRSGAGLGNSVITVLRAGQSVDARSGSTGGWQAVICGGQNGFVSSEFISSGGSSAPSDPEPSNPPSDGNGQTGTVSGTNGDGLYCRSGASSGSSVITVLSPGQQVSVRGDTSAGWVPVTCGGQSGWVSGQYLTIGNGSTNPPPSNPDPAPSPSGLANGDHAKVSDNLNLRYQASLGSGVAAVAPPGTVVLVTGGASNGFYPVDWDGLSGFMSGDYLSKTSEALSERGGSGAPTDPPPGGGGGGSASGNAIVDYAMQYLGYPYVWATHGPASFDCSGFTYWVIQNVVGKDIGYGTWTQVSAGTSVSKSNLQPGDLVFFQNTYTAGLSHVGIYIGNGQFIHAQNESTGVVISDLDSSYYGPRWYGAVRI